MERAGFLRAGMGSALPRLAAVRPAPRRVEPAQPLPAQAVLVEELFQAGPRDAAVLAAGDAVAAQAAGVEPLADGARRDVADPRHLARREHLFQHRTPPTSRVRG